MFRNSSFPKRDVMLIEDSHSMTVLVNALLKQWYNVTNFRDVPQAWNWLKTGNNTDLIICDYCLPVINGFELIKYLRADDLYSDIPVLVLTGLKHENLPEELRTQQVSRILHKPFDPRRFQKIISEIINQVNA